MHWQHCLVLKRVFSNRTKTTTAAAANVSKKVSRFSDFLVGGPDPVPIQPHNSLLRGVSKFNQPSVFVFVVFKHVCCIVCIAWMDGLCTVMGWVDGSGLWFDVEVWFVFTSGLLLPRFLSSASFYVAFYFSFRRRQWPEWNESWLAFFAAFLLCIFYLVFCFSSFRRWTARRNPLNYTDSLTACMWVSV